MAVCVRLTLASIHFCFICLRSSSKANRHKIFHLTGLKRMSVKNQYKVDTFSFAVGGGSNRGEDFFQFHSGEVEGSYFL